MATPTHSQHLSHVLNIFGKMSISLNFNRYNHLSMHLQTANANPISNGKMTKCHIVNVSVNLHPLPAMPTHSWHSKCSHFQISASNHCHHFLAVIKLIIILKTFTLFTPAHMTKNKMGEWGIISWWPETKVIVKFASFFSQQATFDDNAHTATLTSPIERKLQWNS